MREVLARWVENGAWWQQSESGATGSAAGAGVAGARTGAAAGPSLTALAGEREVWRVEASSGRAHGAGVYDLCFDWDAGGWTLLRAQD